MGCLQNDDEVVAMPDHVFLKHARPIHYVHNWLVLFIIFSNILAFLIKSIVILLQY